MWRREIKQRQTPRIRPVANLKFPSGIPDACWDVELASYPRIELACPIAAVCVRVPKAVNRCKRTTTKAGESDMSSYTRFRKRFGAARPRVLGRLLPSILMLAALLFALFPQGEAQRTPRAESEATLFRNVRIFDGKSSTLSGFSNVLVRGNKIERISTSPITVDAGTRVIDGGGRTLMPGLIDVHWHAMLIRPTPAEAISGDVGYNNLVAADEAKDTLMRGFTTVRDVGGPVFGLKHAIDDGTVVGPRIYPSGAVITVTSGHGDFRQLTDLPRTIGGPPTRGEQIGFTAIADSSDEVRMRVREQLMQGASQI